jgi:hypothetical protein
MSIKRRQQKEPAGRLWISGPRRDGDTATFELISGSSISPFCIDQCSCSQHFVIRARGTDEPCANIDRYPRYNLYTRIAQAALGLLAESWRVQ